MVQVRVEVVGQGGNDSSCDGGGDNNRLLYQSLSTKIYFNMLIMTLSSKRTILQCLYVDHLQLLQESSVL
jgi:hypothetical protein